MTPLTAEITFLLDSPYRFDVRYAVPYLQIQPISGARFISLFRILALIGLLSYPFQSDLRSPTGQSAVKLTDGSTVEGIVEERYAQGALWGYQIRGAGFPDGTVSNLLRPFVPGVYIVARADVSSVNPSYTYHMKGLITFPLKFLIIFSLVWLLHVPVLLFWPIYEVAGMFACLLNMVHALITEQNHPELSQFLVRVHQYRWKLLLSLNTEQLPHIDIHGRERGRLPMKLTAMIAPEFSRFQILLRLAVPLFIYAGYRGWLTLQTMVPGPLVQYAGMGLLAAIALPFALILPGQIILWIFLILRRSAPGWLLEIMYRPQMFLLHLGCWWQGLTSNRSVFRSGIKSVRSSGAGNFDPSQGTRVEMNLLVLLILILFSGGLYTLIWLGRTARLMQDDPFTVILVSLIGVLIPLSFLLARYYRRGELMLKTPPSILVEILMMLPGANLILGPFVIQYGLNLYGKAQARTE